MKKKIVLLWALMKQYRTKMKKLFHWNICDFDYKKTNIETPTPLRIIHFSMHFGLKLNTCHIKAVALVYG